MKKTGCILSVFLMLLLLLTSCGAKTETDYSDYTESINPIFEEIENIDTKIRAIDPQKDSALQELSEQLEQLALLFDELYAIEPPEEFIKVKQLSGEAAEYTRQAKEYYKGAFTETEINESKLENANECYNRANKRLHYIIKLIHNETITE